jgi:putative spermidine/putrescine transport system ATP-binding protein
MRSEQPKRGPIIEMRGLCKRYGDAEVLSQVTLDIAEGEFVTLLGPSGSGKTTLLKILSGALEPTSGSIRLRGRDITNLPARFRGIGMVFQNFALMPHLSIFDNIAFPLHIRKTPKAEIKERVAEVLDIVRLPDIGQRKPKELSGGQQQRVAIARALIYRPPVILMDEPLGALDKKLRQQMQMEIKRIHEKLAISMIYVTHDQEEALTMSDRICLMGAGRIQEMNEPSAIYTRPETTFSADFFGATNIFTGQVAARRGQAGIEHDGFGWIESDSLNGQPGEQVGWMVRPERVRLLGSGERDDNMLEGTVEDIILSGQITQLVLKVGNTERLHVACLTGGAHVQEVGQHAQVRVGWSRAATSVLRQTTV